MYDLVVIGGGPAGSAAAITAARRGVRVLLLERGRFPRHKVCGEFVSAESLELLGSLLESNAEAGILLSKAPRIHRGRLFIDHSVLEAPIAPAAASIARVDLDAALWRAAEMSGAEARQQVTVQGITGGREFELTTSEGTVRSRSVINASGRWSNLKSWANGNGKHAKWIGLKAHFLEDQPTASVDLYFFENGYCGVQPIGEDGQLNACAMVRADVANSLPEIFGKHPRLEERSRGWKQISDTVTTSPLIFAEPETDREGVLLAGDSAGFVDPFVGDGISLALRSGALAAECLLPFLQGERMLADATFRYRRAYREGMLPVFHTSSKVRRLFGLPGPVRAGLLMVFENAPWLTRYLIRKTRQDGGMRVRTADPWLRSG